MYKDYKTNLRIIIVGTGSSGSITACYLSNILPNSKITIIDKEIPTIIGVGEGTTPNFHNLLQDCGLTYTDWFKQVDATFKWGIEFQNWGQNKQNIWHPFLADHDSITAFARAELPIDSFKDYCFPLYQILKERKNPILEPNYVFGYHIDATKLAATLQAINEARKNVNYVYSEIIGVQYNDKDITEIICKNGKSYTADIYVDCTGFTNILSQHKKKIDLQDTLFCNSAVVTQLPFNKTYQPAPFTESVACDHGWIWAIPTTSRLGTGLVFNRNITDIDLAVDELCSHWKKYNYNIDKSKVRFLKWDPFYLQDPWEGNCITLGLGSAFVEPLEATSLIQLGFNLSRFGNNLFAYKDFKDKVQKEYNDYSNNLNQEIVDFILLHYETNWTHSPFWQYVSNNFKTPYRATLFESWMRDPSKATNFVHDECHMFNFFNYTVWMAQQKQAPFNYTDGFSKEHAHNWLRQEIKDTIDKNKGAIGPLELSSLICKKL